MNKGICFLDIDGVVNTKEISYKKSEFYTGYYNWYEEKVNNKTALLWVSKLCIEQKLEIVIISDWAIYLSDNKMREILYNSGLIYGVNIINILRGNRSNSIENYVNNNKIERYVILDDQVGYYNLKENDIKNHLVLCDEDYGFVGQKKYDEAISILNGKKVLKKSNNKMNL